MNIEYVTKHFHLDDPTKSYVEDKLQKITKFVEQPEFRLILETENNGRRLIADVHVAHRHGVLQASEATESDMRDSILHAIEKVEKQARRSHNKFIDKRRRADRAVQEEHRWSVDVLEGASVGSGNEPRIVKTGHLPIKPMTIDEAALQLGDSKNEFIVFRDAGSQRVNVLYRRKDANFGLIDAEP